MSCTHDRVAIDKTQTIAIYTDEGQLVIGHPARCLVCGDSLLAEFFPISEPKDKGPWEPLEHDSNVLQRCAAYESDPESECS